MGIKGLAVAVGLLGAAVSEPMRIESPGGDAAPVLQTAEISRGDVVDAVAATGTVQAVTTVQVGSQVSGNISRLAADFHSMVRN
jgi:HlyD family secretion protein